MDQRLESFANNLCPEELIFKTNITPTTLSPVFQLFPKTKSLDFAITSSSLQVELDSIERTHMQKMTCWTRLVAVLAQWRKLFSGCRLRSERRERAKL